MAVRLSVRGAEQDPETINLIRRAFARMQGLHDDRGYDFFASLHGLSLPVWCQHGTPLFLPWHRAFLYYFELALQTRLGPRFTVMEPQEPDLTDVGLPWWDWTSDESHGTGLPESYRDSRDEIRCITRESRLSRRGRMSPRVCGRGFSSKRYAPVRYLSGQLRRKIRQQRYAIQIRRMNFLPRTTL